jgi:hypothetical protein
MGLGRIRLLFAMAVGLMALAPPAAAGALVPTRLSDDWRDGRIDGVYSSACYRQTLAHLPEDVRVYSTAQADITRALQARLGTVAAKSSVTAAERRERRLTAARRRDHRGAPRCRGIGCCSRPLDRLARHGGRGRDDGADRVAGAAASFVFPSSEIYGGLGSTYDYGTTASC